MVQFFIITGIILVLLVIAEFFIIKNINQKLKNAKAEVSTYKEYVVSANKRFEFMYNYIKDVGKVDEWKIKELQRLEEEDKNDVINDIITANNSRVQNNTGSKS